MARSWEPILAAAAKIVRSYDTPVTLRQLFYRLVSAELLRNKQSDYSQLSSRTAQGRREGWFPRLLDQGREVSRYQTFDGVDDARSYIARIYRRDRTEGQEFSIYLGVEKATLTSQLDSWFGDLGLPIVALRGYSSETLEREFRDDVLDAGRPAVLLYAGDFDPSGEDILRNFTERTAVDVMVEGCPMNSTEPLIRVERIALTPDQIEEYDLPPQPGKSTDSRAKGFEARHGELIQVEVEALDPDDLRQLFQGAIDEFFDTSTWEQVLEQEEQDRAELAREDHGPTSEE